MRFTGTMIAVLLAASLTTGCAMKLGKLKIAIGNSKVTDEEVSGGSMSDGLVSMGSDLVDAGVRLASGIVPGVSPKPAEKLTVVIEDDSEE